MKKRAFSSIEEWINLSSLANHIWKNARQEIIRRAVQAGPKDLLKKLPIPEDQIKRLLNSEVVPADLLVRLNKECQRRTDLQGQLIALAYFSLEDEESESQERERLPWESLLMLLLLAYELGFEHPWLQSEKEGVKFLNSGDLEIQQRCDQACKYLSAIKTLEFFGKLAQKVFYKKLSGYLEALENSVENVEQFEKLQLDLLKIIKESRKFLNFARTVRKALNELMAENKELVLEGDLSADDNLAFIKLLNQKSAEWSDNLKNAAASALPRLFDSAAIRQHLEKVAPPISSKDFDLMLEELAEIEQDLLSQDDSQLMSNILPALLKEKAFDMDAFESAMDKSQAKDYSHKFIRHLFDGLYLIPNEDSGPDEDLDESGTEDKASDIAQAEAEESLELMEPLAEAESEPQSESADEMAHKDEEAFIEAGEEEQAAYETLSSGSGENSTEQINAAESDGFEFIEDSLSAPPQPEEDSVKSAPETMTIEQAIIVSERENKEENAVLPEDEEDLSIKDPLERKFLRKKREENRKLMENLSERSSSSASSAAIVSSTDKTAEKKSLESGEKVEAKTDLDARLKLAFRKFIRTLDNIKEQRQEQKELEEPKESLRNFLDQGELEAFVCLSRVLGDNSPYSAALAELFYLGRQYMPGQEEMSSRLQDLIAHVLEESENYTEDENLLLAAAILKPSLMIPNEQIHTIISVLAGKLAHYGLSPFFKALQSLLSQRISLDPTIFTGESEERLRETRAETLRKDTEDFLRRMRNLRATYQPASKLRKLLYGQTGKLGSMLEKCLQGEAGDISAFIAKHGNERAMERFIDDTEIPHRTRQIEANARQRLLGELRQAMDLLRGWRDYFERCAAPVNRNYSVEKIHELFEKLPADIGRLNKVPEGRFLAEQIRELSGCPQKPLSRKAERPRRALRLWPLRIPFMDPESKSMKDAGFFVTTVLSKKHYDENFVAASLVTHLGMGRLSLCQDYLEAYPSIKNIIPDMAELTNGALEEKDISVEKYMAIADLVWDELFQELIEKAKADIVACEFRGVLHMHQPAKYLNQLAIIVQEAEESGDKAEAAACLEQIREDLEKIGEDEMAEIKEKISKLEERTDLSPECKLRLSLINETYLKDKMLNLAWNELAELTDHLSKDKPLGTLPASLEAVNDIAHDFYGQLEKGETGERSGDAAHIWDTAASLLQVLLANNKLGSLAIKAMEDLLDWLGFTLDQSQQPIVLHSSPAPNLWRAIAMKMEISGPLPQWNNRHTRHIAAFGWNVQPENINQLLQANFMDNEDCKTIICFNKMDFEARKRLMALCVQRKIAPLIIDENLFNFLSAFKKPARTNALFSIGLVGTGIIPYVNVGGAVPREMFFGREDDIRALVDSMGPCLVYGGRQLGKSAILQQIHNNKRDGIKTVLHSMANSESSLLEAIRNECVEAGILHPATLTKNLSLNIKKWLKDNPDWRLLVLLDECDHVLDLDRAKGFDELGKLRDLMEQTERRFKVVLTGLHSVQRFSKDPNHPLIHFTDSLCIGPLSPGAAYDLMTVPMSFLGVEFADKLLVQLALNHCGYQPKLIQIFCMELLKGLSSKGRKVPFETIDAEGIQKIYGSRNLKKKIIECFELTLNLDERYLVIGYVLAINQHIKAKMDLNQLLQELKYYWPDAFADNRGKGSAETINSLRTLLHEMEGLGLVTRLDNEYMLRTPNVIDLLGGMDQIYTKLDPYIKRKYKPALSLDEMRVQGFENFTASQFNQLIEKRNSLHWISGNTALGLDLIETELQRIVEKQNRYDPMNGLQLVKLNGNTEHEVFKTLRKKYEGLEGGMICLLDSAEFAFTDKFMEKARDWLKKLRTERKYVKIICIIDPATLQSFIRNGQADKFADSQIQLMPWSRDGLEQYYKESIVLDGPGSDKILEASGGWSKLVEAYFNKQTSVNPLSLSDFWNGDARLIRELVDFIAKRVDGLLEKEKLEEDASAIVEMFPGGINMAASDMLAWIRTLHSLFILRDSENMLQLDPIAKAAIMEGSAQ